MARHSFVQMSKLPDVKGRVDYISNPKRQEHLYATYSTVEPEFWKYLSEQAQYDFWKSNQIKGKCIEARELIIALPEALQEKNPELLLQLFVQNFQEEYGVQCTAALHHNKTKTNYHIHLIFADRDVLPNTQVKYASRNMFYDEKGRHVRTKKEVLGEDGQLRPGCKMIPKGEPYEVNWFSGHKDIFKTKDFLKDVKVMYTDLINQCVGREEDKLAVYRSDGPYLATKKIGKNNPLEEKIRADNVVKQEWNHMVDRVLIAGGTIEEVTDFKQEEVLKKISKSITEYGSDPTRLHAVIARAIAILKIFLQILMERVEQVEVDFENQSSPVAKLAIPTGKDPRPDSLKEELEYNQVKLVWEELDKVNRKMYALHKKRVGFKQALDKVPGGFFHRKERKELEEKIAGLDRQLELAQEQFESIPKMNGYKNVEAVKKAYINAGKALQEVRKRQAEWDGVELPVEQKVQTQKQKESVLKELAKKQAEVSEQHVKRSRKRQMERW